MDPKTKKLTAVGIVTALLTTLLAVSIIVVGGSKMLLGNRYTLTANFPNAQGLYVGSIVSLAGIQVGNVTKIKVHPDGDSILVHLNLDDDHAKRITENSKASIRTMGVLGDKFIYIAPAKTGQSLVDGDFIGAERRDDFLSSLDERAPDLKYVSDILRESALMIQSMNENNKTAVMIENFKNASENLDQLSSRPETLESLVHLSSVLRKIDQGEGTIGKLINDPSLYNRLMDLTGASKRNRFLGPMIQNAFESAKD